MCQGADCADSLDDFEPIQRESVSGVNCFLPHFCVQVVGMKCVHLVGQPLQPVGQSSGNDVAAGTEYPERQHHDQEHAKPSEIIWMIDRHGQSSAISERNNEGSKAITASPTVLFLVGFGVWQHGA